MKYAGFWRRLGALIVDLVVIAPIGILLVWLNSQSRTFAIISVLPWTIVTLFYQVYFHARWGQTIGKMATGIKVISLDGSPISWGQALLRSSVDIALGILFVIIRINALMKFPESEYLSLGWLQQDKRMQEIMETWHWITWIENVWISSEVIVMLFNAKRRALHDFIAGTVVIHNNKQGT